MKREARAADDDDPKAKLMPEGYKARAEQVILPTVWAWEANCPHHMLQRL